MYKANQDNTMVQVFNVNMFNTLMNERRYVTSYVNTWYFTAQRLSHIVCLTGEEGDNIIFQLFHNAFTLQNTFFKYSYEHSINSKLERSSGQSHQWKYSNGQPSLALYSWQVCHLEWFTRQLTGKWNLVILLWSKNTAILYRTQKTLSRI